MPETLLPYPQMPAIPAPTSGDIATWGNGLAMPNLTNEAIDAISAQDTLPYGTPYTIRAWGERPHHYENTLGDVPVSAAYDVDGVILQAFLIGFGYAYGNFHSYSFSMPSPSGWIGTTGVWNESGLPSGWVYRTVNQELSPGNWFDVNYSERWGCFSHSKVAARHVPSMTNLIALTLLGMVLSEGKDLFPVKLRRWD
jgi:hypothetical protein